METELGENTEELSYNEYGWIDRPVEVIHTTDQYKKGLRGVATWESMEFISINGSESVILKDACKLLDSMDGVITPEDGIKRPRLEKAIEMIKNSDIPKEIWQEALDNIKEELLDNNMGEIQG